MPSEHWEDGILTVVRKYVGTFVEFRHRFKVRFSLRVPIYAVF